MKPENHFFKVASLLGAAAVLLGAFTAHFLKNRISTDALLAFETGVRYQFYHVFALIIIGLLMKSDPHRRLIWAGRLFIIGIILFSGSLYYLSAIQEVKWLRFATPMGGLCFIAGWIMLFTYWVRKT